MGIVWGGQDSELVMAALELKLQECLICKLNKQKVTHTQTKPNMPAPIYTQLPHPESCSSWRGSIQSEGESFYGEVGEESKGEEEAVAFFPAELWISAGVLYMQLYLSEKEL